MMSVFGEDECDGGGGGGGVTWVWENKSLCGGGNMRSPTEMLNSFTD